MSAGSSPVVPTGFQPSTALDSIPVVFHVIRGVNPRTDVSNAVLEDQIEVLNQGYLGTNISFYLLGIARLEDEVLHDSLNEKYEDIAPYLNIDPNRVLNIYVGSSTFQLGSTRGPGTNGSGVGNTADVIFLKNTTFPGTGGYSDEGDVAVHETGHYFGLVHTYEGGCTGAGDGISDTPAEAAGGALSDPSCTVASCCPIGRDSCPLQLGNDPIHNFMNNSDDACRYEFTLKQDDVQEYVREVFRDDLGQNVPTVYDARSPAVTFNNHTFSGNDIFVLPGADITVSGTVTLTNGARFVAIGGTDLTGVTGVDIEDGSNFTVRRYDAPLDFYSAIDIRTGGVFRVGTRDEPPTNTPDASSFGNSSFSFATPPLFAAGDITVSDPGSKLIIGNYGVLSLGASRVALFENGGQYVTWGGTELEADAQLILEADAAAPEIRPGFADLTLALGRDARLVLRNGDYTLGGSTVGGQDFPFTVGRLDPNEAWDEIALDGDGLTFDDAVIEGGTSGVKVYDPGSVTITGSILRDNGVGLDVRSSAGTVVSGSTIEQNGTGVQGGFIDCYGTSCPCFSSCRGDLDLVDSFVRDNAGTGVFLADADADITGTQISGNGDDGLYLSNALVPFFTNNFVLDNGTGIASGTGAFVAAGGDFFLSPENNIGLNRVAHNADEEVYVYSSGFVFAGDDSGNTGENAIFDASGGVLFANPTKPLLDANVVYWGASGGPPPGSIAGFVNSSLPLSCDPVNPPDPNDPAPCAGSRNAGNGGIKQVEGVTERGGSLGAEIRAVRAALAADPTSEEAAGLVRHLASLHRRDRNDTENEHAASFGLLRSLRAHLNNPTLLPRLRVTAEAALEAVVVDALTHERYEAAASAISTWRPRAEGLAVLQVLALVEASLEAQAGRYAEAGALVAAVAANETDEGAARGLSALATHYTGRAAGDGARSEGTPAAVATVPLGERIGAGEVGAVPPGLAVYPNPIDGLAEATVALALDTAAEVRVVVYDMLGREVATLYDGDLLAGAHAFALDAAVLPAGMYLIRAEDGTHRFTERLTVVR